MSETSYIWLMPEQAAAAAEAKLVAIEASRKRRVKEFVTRRMQELNKPGWWPFKRRNWTYEQVEEMERSMPDLWANTIWEIETWDYSSQVRLCEKVIALAKLNRPLQLSLDDAHSIGADS